MSDTDLNRPMIFRLFLSLAALVITPGSIYLGGYIVDATDTSGDPTAVNWVVGGILGLICLVVVVLVVAVLWDPVIEGAQSWWDWVRNG